MMFYKKTVNKLFIISIFLVVFLIVFKGIITEEMNKKIKDTGEVSFSVEPGFYKEAFELELQSDREDIYYTLDGTLPNKKSIKYEEPIWITDATSNDNVHSVRKDVSTGFDREEIEKISSDYPAYETPDYKVDKATIIRAVACDEFGNYSEVKTASYFVGFADRGGYEGMKILSLITEPASLFDFETGIYVTGKSYDEYVEKYRGSGEYYWREEFWGFWNANYRNRGMKWERQAEIQCFDERGNLELSQKCGVRIHGGISRGYNPKSLNLYARKEYDGNKVFQADLFGTGYYPSAMVLFQGGNDVRTKAKDYIVAEVIENLNVATVNYEPYVLFLNGEYWGIYWLNEKYNAEFFSYYYDVDKDNVIMIKNGELEEGEEDDLKYYSMMYDFCSQADVSKEENYARVCELIDIESYIDYYAVMCYIGRSGDWPWLNYGLWRTKKAESGLYGDEKWRWIIFDLNSPGFDTGIDTIGYVMENDEMFKNMMNNKQFRTKLLERIAGLSDTVFHPDLMNGILSEYQNFITEPMRENDKRFFGDASLTVFTNEIENLKNFFAVRREHFIPILEQYK